MIRDSIIFFILSKLPCRRSCHVGFFVWFSSILSLKLWEILIGPLVPNVCPLNVPFSARSLSDYRCPPGGFELYAPSPANRSLPTIPHCVPCFHDHMPVSCEVNGSKCPRPTETNGLGHLDIWNISVGENNVVLCPEASKTMTFNLRRTQMPVLINGNWSIYWSNGLQFALCSTLA